MTERVRISLVGGLLVLDLAVAMYDIYSFHHQSVYRESEERFLALIERIPECFPTDSSTSR